MGGGEHTWHFSTFRVSTLTRPTCSVVDVGAAAVAVGVVARAASALPSAEHRRRSELAVVPFRDDCQPRPLASTIGKDLDGTTQDETPEGQTPGPGRSRETNRLVARVVAQAGPWAAVLAVNAVVLAAAELALPAVLGQSIDAVLQTGGDALTGVGGFSWLAVLALLIAVLVAGDALEDLGVGGSTARSTSRLRHDAFGHVLRVGLRGTRRLSSGELTARLVGNTAEAGTFAPDLVRAVATVIPAVGGTIALLLIDPWLCLTFLIVAPLLVAVLWIFTRDAADLSDSYLATQGTIASRLVQALTGARTIAAAGTADREVRRVLEPLDDLHRHGVGMWRAQSRITVQDMLLFAMLEIAVLVVAGLQLSRGRITPGELLAASQYVALAATMSGVVPSLSRMIRARSAVARLLDVFDQQPTAYGQSVLPPSGGRVQLREVTVRSGDRAVLDRVNLVIPAGALVAVVGRSGSGKSLLARLIVRLAEPDEGEVLLDWVPLQQLDRLQLRRAVGYGFERPTLVGATLADAISFGVDHPDPSEVVAAAQAARADDFIRRMPGSYRTALSDAPMSGGELQRLGLARTFAHANRVLVLDDVAASLDTVTDHQISTVLTVGMAGRTRVLVAHRASTAARADAVIWLDGAAIRAVAPHRELWADPDYRALFEAADVAAPDRPVVLESAADTGRVAAWMPG